jgi:hypothetical protein
MQKNVGGLDRTARIVVGPLLLVAAVAAFTGYLAVGTVVGAVSLVAGMLMVVTGTTQKCPAHKLTGMDTTQN